MNPAGLILSFFTCLQVEGSLEQGMSLALGCHSKLPFPVRKPYQHFVAISPPALLSQLPQCSDRI